MPLSDAPALGRPKKCGREGCTCTRHLMPLTEILYGEEHPKHFHHTKISDSYEQVFAVHEHMDLFDLKKVSRKFPKVYRFVKARKEKNVNG